jgi:hypothetical protein
MNNAKTSPAKKTYCVWADQTVRVYQEVEAESPEQAHELAWKRPECWETCVEHESNGYRLSDDVEDVESQEWFTVVDVESCKTCGNLIEPTVNGGNFNDGECGECERRRYESQPALLDAAERAVEEIAQWDEVMGGSEDPRTKEAVDALDAAIARAYAKGQAEEHGGSA